jgi:hypothetical protein
MASGAYLTGQDAAVADAVEPARPTWPQSRVSSPTLEAWPIDHQVIDFGAAADARFADGGAVDGAIGLDFDVILEHGNSRLLGLAPASVRFARVTEAVAANHRAVLQDHPIAELAVFADAGMGVGEESFADARAAINGDEAVQDGVRADHHVVIDKTIRANVGAYADLRGGGDHGGGMNFGLVAGRLMKKVDGARKIQIRIA